MAQRWLEERIEKVPARLRASVVGLSDEHLDAHPFAGKWSLREYVHHIVEVDLGWSDMLYEAVAPDASIGRAYDAEWNKAALARSKASIAAALDVFDQNHCELLQFLAPLPDEAFEKMRPPVKWMKTHNLQFQINDNGNWGLVMHVDHSLQFMHRLREKVGKPLDWMATIRRMHPPGSKRGKDGSDFD